MRSVIISAMAAVLVSGCATTYDPVQIGRDTYTSAGSWGWTSSSAIWNDLYREASAFCARQGRAIDVLQATGHIVAAGKSGDKTGRDADWGGKYANAELTFMCLDRNDPQYARKQVQFQPNMRVQVVD
jgi:hypothetical protein